MCRALQVNVYIELISYTDIVLRGSQCFTFSKHKQLTTRTLQHNSNDSQAMLLLIAPDPSAIGDPLASQIIGLAFSISDKRKA